MVVMHLCLVGSLINIILFRTLILYIIVRSVNCILTISMYVTKFNIYTRTDSHVDRDEFITLNNQNKMNIRCKIITVIKYNIIIVYSKGSQPF